jgi:hypothetical protein
MTPRNGTWPAADAFPAAEETATRLTQRGPIAEGPAQWTSGIVKGSFDLVRHVLPLD